MTAQLLEADHVTDNDNPEDDHVICVVCYPGFQPGVVVLSICGADTPDMPPDEDFNPDMAGCTFCARMSYCPICGDKI